MRFQWWNWVVAAVLVTSPGVARSQCMGGPIGGGHPGGSHAHESGSRAEKKTRESIQRLLSDDRGRALLMEVVLADAAFMRGLAAGMAKAPEWRALIREQLADDAAAPVRNAVDTTVTVKPRPDTSKAMYTCPMHPEVLAAQPGRCPKCGMSLERVGSGG